MSLDNHDQSSDWTGSACNARSSRNARVMGIGSGAAGPQCRGARKTSSFRQWQCAGVTAWRGSQLRSAASSLRMARLHELSGPCTATGRSVCAGGLDRCSRARRRAAARGAPGPARDRGQSPRGGGIVATDLVAKAPADGYTLLIGSIATMAVAPALYEKLPYAPLRDFAHIGLWVTFPLVLVVNASSPVTGLKELIAAGEGKTRHAKLRRAGHRQFVAYLCRPDEQSGAHQGHHRALQGRRAGDERPACRGSGLLDGGGLDGAGAGGTRASCAHSV